MTMSNIVVNIFSKRSLTLSLSYVGYVSGSMNHQRVLGTYPGAAPVWDDLRQLETAAVA